MSEDLSRLVEILRGGGVVACPTETLVGLLAGALDPDAVAKVARMKGRASEQPVAVLLPDADAIDAVARDVPERARELARAHWPGPLTLVLWARDGLPPELVRDGKVGMRVPGRSPALELVRAFGGPLTATSANRTGEPPARTDAEARAALGGDVDAYVPGSAPGGLASTVVDATEDPPRMLRRGAVTLD